MKLGLESHGRKNGITDHAQVSRLFQGIGGVRQVLIRLERYLGLNRDLSHPVFSIFVFECALRAAFIGDNLQSAELHLIQERQH